MCSGLTAHQIIQIVDGVELIKYAWIYFLKMQNIVKGFVVRFVVRRRAKDLLVVESNRVKSKRWLLFSHQGVSNVSLGFLKCFSRVSKMFLQGFSNVSFIRYICLVSLRFGGCMGLCDTGSQCNLKYHWYACACKRMVVYASAFASLATLTVYCNLLIMMRMVDAKIIMVCMCK